MQRIGNNLDSPPGTQKVSDIEAELAGAQTTLTNATDRHQQSRTRSANAAAGRDASRRTRSVPKFSHCRRACRPRCRPPRCCSRPAWSTTCRRDDQSRQGSRAIRQDLAAAEGPRLGAAGKAGGDFAVDADERRQLFAARFGHDRQRLVHDEHAKIGDVLADFAGQRIAVAGDRGQENVQSLRL